MPAQVALFDRVHSMRVKAIQEEYQRYMERVRTKAQTAIDQANAQYQHSRAMLTARVDALVHFLQSRHAQVHTRLFSLFPRFSRFSLFSLFSLFPLFSLFWRVHHHTTFHQAARTIFHDRHVNAALLVLTFGFSVQIAHHLCRCRP